MFERFMTEQEVCEKWALFHVGDTVYSDCNKYDKEGVLAKGSKVKITEVHASDILNYDKILASEQECYVLKNRYNSAFSYKVIDEESDTCFWFEERELLDEKGKTCEPSLAYNRWCAVSAISLAVAIIVILFVLALGIVNLVCVHFDWFSLAFGLCVCVVATAIALFSAGEVAITPKLVKSKTTLQTATRM